MRTASHRCLISALYAAAMTRKLKRRSALVAALAIAAATAGIGIAAGTGEDEGADSDANLSGAAAQRASDAALSATGGGTVVEVEAGDDGGAAYEVEVRKSDGSTVEVRLDTNLDVVGTVDEDD